MLENLRAIKAKHVALCSQVKEIAAAQKESMDSIRHNLGGAMELVQRFQQNTDLQVPAMKRFMFYRLWKVSALEATVQILSQKNIT